MNKTPMQAAVNKTLMQAALTITTLTAVAACSPAASPSSAAPASPASAAGTAAPGTARNLAPLTLGHFPGTADGKLAKAICGQWASLRQQYADKSAADSAYQMNQWFSSAAWSKVQNDATALGNAPAYDHLETALGVAITGDMAGAASVAAMDKACEAAD